MDVITPTASTDAHLSQDLMAQCGYLLDLAIGSPDGGIYAIREARGQPPDRPVKDPPRSPPSSPSASITRTIGNLWDLALSPTKGTCNVVRPLSKLSKSRRRAIRRNNNDAYGYYGTDSDDGTPVPNTPQVHGVPDWAHYLQAPALASDNIPGPIPG